MAVERAYWSARKIIEGRVGDIIFNIGNNLALKGHKRLGEKLIGIGLPMAFLATIPHRPFIIDPMLLNPDGSFSMPAFQAKLDRQYEKDKTDPEFIRMERLLSDIKQAGEHTKTEGEEVHLLNKQPSENS